MTPDWLIQLTWFGAGISATGAFWYFLAQRNYHGTLWAGYMTMVLALLAIAFLVRNDIIRREAQPAPGSSSPTAEDAPRGAGSGARATESSPDRPTRKDTEITLEHGSQPPQSLSQSIINSPGAIQAGRDVIISADPQLVRSIELRIAIETTTRRASPGAETFDFGLGSVVALFTKDKQRFRFASDMRVFDQQVTDTRRRLRFVYQPEDPAQILGRPIDLLGTFEVLAVNYVEVFQTEKFDTTLGGTAFECGVVINGLPLAQIRADVQPSGLLNHGQANLSVADTFGKIPNAYRAIVGEARKR